MQIRSGKNLDGWKLKLGDVIASYGNEPEVDLTDLKTVNKLEYSVVHANIKKRHIKAHNITHSLDINENNLTAIHASRYQFRLPFVPKADPNSPVNGETIEGGFFVWDGKTTRRDYGVAFQWVINPWDPRFGNINSWKGDAGWEKNGKLALDTEWHEVWMVVDCKLKTASLVIDGMPIPCYFSTTKKSKCWGNTIDARLQAEVVSINPGPSKLKVPHRAEFRKWSWIKNVDRS